MQCYGNEEKECSNVCCMWVDDNRCPNFEWLATDRAKERANKKEV